jgi:ABC-type branched-subunit amino acid transport system permease subunit
MNFFSTNIILVENTLIVILLALSIQIPLRLGVFSFAAIGYYAIGAYSSAILMLEFGWGSWEAMFVATVFATVVAYLLGLVLARLTGLYLGMATIAFDLILVVIVLNGGSLTGGPVGLFGVLGSIELWHLAAAVIIVLALLTLTERGKLARRFDAVREDPQLASSMGIDVVSYRRLSFLISGALGGLAGAFAINLRTTISPESIGFGLVVLGLTVIIVGGQASWVGAVIGACIFVWLPKLLDFVGDWEEIIYGMVVVLAAIFIPGGIVGLFLEAKHRRQSKRNRSVVEQVSALLAGEDEHESRSAAVNEGAISDR